MTPATFVAALADYHLSAVFNPYVDHCPVHDRADAAWRRRSNLVGFLEAALTAHVDTLSPGPEAQGFDFPRRPRQ